MTSDHAAAYRGLRLRHPDPLVQSTIATIREQGWAVTAVSDLCECSSPECRTPQCPFAYTSGMGLHGIPELAVYGLGAYRSGAVLNELGDLLHRYEWRGIVDHRVEVTLTTLGVPVRIIEMVDKSDLLITNELFRNTPALQVVWPDDRGSYPWEAGYGLHPQDQLIKGIADTGSGRWVGPRVIAPNRSERRRERRKGRGA